MIRGYDHVQVAIPRGGEDAARAYYGALLGMSEVPKPPALAVRGGCWFTSGSAVLHLGVEHPFVPARKAHPAFVVDDLTAVADILRAAGYLARFGAGNVRPGDTSLPDSEEIPGVQRFHTYDPFGNRLEFQQA